MKKGNKKIFLDKNKLWNMVVLRRSGWSITSLSKIFNCDFTSIEDRCNKYGIYPLGSNIYSIERILKQTLKPIEKEKTPEQIAIFKSHGIWLSEERAKSEYKEITKWSDSQKNLSNYL